MDKFRFAAGTEVSIDGVLHRIVRRNDEGWQLVAEESGLLGNRTEVELGRLYANGKLVFATARPSADTASHGQKHRRPDVLISDLPPEQRTLVEFRLAALRDVELCLAAAEMTAGAATKRTALLTTALAEVSLKYGRARPVSIATYYRWRNRYAERENAVDLLRLPKPSGRRLHPRVAQIIIATLGQALKDASDKTQPGRKPKFTISDVKTKCESLIAHACRLDPSIPSKPPVLATYYNYLRINFSAHDRALARYGKTMARMLFRGVRGHEEPEACLDVVQYDETRMPLFLVDELLGVPLGRPWLNWGIDEYSDEPIGIYLGFEPPSDLTIASAIRHSCLPKAYVQEEYPDIEHPWLGGGIARMYVLDRGLAQRGRSLEDIVLDLNSYCRWTQVRTPWFKPIVEGMFNVLNQRLLSEMPGFSLGKQVDHHDYDPTQNACIGIRHFLHIFHKWLCDIYCEDAHGILGSVPNIRWREGIAKHEPEFLSRARDLDLVFGIVRSAAVDHRGIVYQNLRYYSEALHEFRRRHGNRLGRGSVRVKVNPNDLGRIHVWEPTEQCWLPVDAIRRDYAKGLTLHCHQLYLKHARESYKSRDVESLCRSKQDLQAMISDALPLVLSMRANTSIARALGIGTQHIFDHLDHDGHLGQLSGPFAGQRLNLTTQLQNQAEIPRSQESATHAAKSDPDMTIWKRRVEMVPRLEADHSLKGTPK